MPTRPNPLGAERARGRQPSAVAFGERMFGPYIHQIDPILFDVAGVHVWWYGLGFAAMWKSRP